jgi:uncharacterized membrane protein
MKFRYFFLIVCIYSTTLLYAKQSTLSDILQKAGEKKIIVKPIPKKQEARKESHFIFKDTYDTNGIGINHNKRVKNAVKSKSYEYENKSRFKFKFTPGTDVSNIVAGQGSGSTASGGSGGGGASMGGGGGGQGRGGGRR